MFEILSCILQKNSLGDNGNRKPFHINVKKKISISLKSIRLRLKKFHKNFRSKSWFRLVSLISLKDNITFYIYYGEWREFHIWPSDWILEFTTFETALFPRGIFRPTQRFSELFEFCNFQLSVFNWSLEKIKAEPDIVYLFIT